MCKYLGQFHLSRDSDQQRKKNIRARGYRQKKSKPDHSMGRNTLVYLHFKAPLYVKHPDWNQIRQKKTCLAVNTNANVAFLDGGVVRKVLERKWYRLAEHKPSRQEERRLQGQRETCHTEIGLKRCRATLNGKVVFRSGTVQEFFSWGMFFSKTEQCLL